MNNIQQLKKFLPQYITIIKTPDISSHIGQSIKRETVELKIDDLIVVIDTLIRIGNNKRKQFEAVMKIKKSKFF